MSRTPKPDSRSVYDKALGLLARREHSARELKTKLALRGHAADEAGTVIDRLQERDYQSDARFAASLARRRASQGYGPLRIEAELKSHLVDAASIRAALQDADIDWTRIAAAQLARHAQRGESSDPGQRAKRTAFLLRRGFDTATVRAVTRADGSASAPDSD